jgi:hypothetical protein
MSRLICPIVFSFSGALLVVVVLDEVAGSRKPRPVIGSGDSCTTRARGKDVKAVGDVVRDWSKCLYSKTVPSPRPIARCDRFVVIAMHET